MRRLLIVFAILLLVAVAAGLLGILFARRAPGTIGGPTVLVWRLAEQVVEQAPGDSLPFPGYHPPTSIATVYEAFRKARRDPAVKGVALVIQDTRFGLAKAQELRRQLLLVRQHGKFADCYLETAGEGTNGTLDYFLATGCGSIHLAPTGTLNLLGLLADGVFLRGTLDKLKITPDFNHVGEYKSASEIFTMSEHSPAAEEAINAVLDSDYAQIAAAIAEERELELETVKELVDNAPYTAAEALAHGLVDALSYPDQFREHLEQASGGEPRLVSLLDYRPRRSLLPRSKVAVVFAAGTILRGESGAAQFTGELVLGADDLGEILRELREDDSIAAVVLRIDSPGGSALASDLILRQVELLAAEKPVVVSMADVAASGGYYIAAKAHKIVAEAGTLTGSIGVVGGKFVTRSFESEVLGITHDPLQRGRNANFYSSLEPFSPEQGERVRHLMRSIYDTFVGHVAEGRKLSREAVEAVAEGRVWTGSDAHRLGLVDELGGLDRALELAREAAGLAADRDLALVYYPEPPNLFELFSQMSRPLLLAPWLRQLAEPLAGPPQLLELPPGWRSLAAPF